MSHFSLLNSWAMAFVVASLQDGHLQFLFPGIHIFVLSCPLSQIVPGLVMINSKSDSMSFLRFGYKRLLVSPLWIGKSQSLSISLSLHNFTSFYTHTHTHPTHIILLLSPLFVFLLFLSLALLL
jgi:hypothetical protein